MILVLSIKLSIITYSNGTCNKKKDIHVKLYVFCIVTVDEHSDI